MEKIDQVSCHKGWKTLRQADYAIEHGYECDDCGGDTRKPTGLKYEDIYREY